MVKDFTRWCETVDIALAQEVVLQAQGLFPNLLENRQRYILVFITSVKVLDPRVIFIDFGHDLTALELLLVVSLAKNRVGNVRHLLRFFIKGFVEGKLSLHLNIIMRHRLVTLAGRRRTFFIYFISQLFAFSHFTQQSVSHIELGFIFHQFLF